MYETIAQECAAAIINAMDIGNRVKRLRERQGLSQGELARLAGLSRPTVSNLENGKRADPAASSVQALADALGTTSDYLIRGVSPSPARVVSADGMSVPLDGDGGANVPAGATVSKVVFQEDIESLDIKAGDVGTVIHGPVMADSLSLVRWPDDRVRLVMLHDIKGMTFMRTLKSDNLILFEEGRFSNVGVLAEIRRELG